MERFVIALLLVFALPGPWWLSLISRNVDWPVRAKQVVALIFMGLFTGLMAWILFSEIRGNRGLVVGVKVFVLGYFLIGLYTAYNGWPRGGRPAERVIDIRTTLEEAIKDMEDRLRLSSVERLEHLNPREGTYSHHLVRYADGSWLEWLNPTNEDGTPDFSLYAVYSNNRDIVKLLAEALSPPCSVERTDQPLWHDQR